MKKTLAALATLLLLTACGGGGGGGGRPSADEIADALKDDGNPAYVGDTGFSDAAIDCIAQAFYDSELSDDALQALVDGDDDYDDSGDEDVMASGDLQGQIAECAQS